MHYQKTTSGSRAFGPHPQFALGCASRSSLQRMSQSGPSESSDMTNRSPGALSAMQGQRKNYIIVNFFGHASVQNRKIFSRATRRPVSPYDSTRFSFPRDACPKKFAIDHRKFLPISSFGLRAGCQLALPGDRGFARTFLTKASIDRRSKTCFGPELHSLDSRMFRSATQLIRQHLDAANVAKASKNVTFLCLSLERAGTCSSLAAKGQLGRCPDRAVDRTYREVCKTQTYLIPT